MSELDLAWLAGLLEGEGCFSLQKKTYRRADGGVTEYRYPTVVLSMTDEDVVRRAAALVAAPSVRRQYPPSTASKGYLPQYRWTLAGTQAADLMRLVLPLMGTRRQARIREVLAA